MIKQTAVDYFMRKLKSIDKYLPEEVYEEYTKAKQMEKEQIEDAWHDGKMLGVNGNIIESYDTPEGFYQKNYGQ
jgi:hypothetical protein